MGATLKKFLENEGAWEGLLPENKTLIEEINERWDGRIIRRINEVADAAVKANSQEPINLMTVIGEVVGANDPKLAPPEKVKAEKKKEESPSATPDAAQTDSQTQEPQSSDVPPASTDAETDNGILSRIKKVKIPDFAKGWFSKKEGQPSVSRGNPIKGLGNMAGKAGENPHYILKFVALAVTILLLGYFGYEFVATRAGSGVQGFLAPTGPSINWFEPPQVVPPDVNAAALDIRHGPKQVGQIHMFIILCGLMIAWLVYMDAAQRREKGDAYAIAVAIFVLIVLASVVTALEPLVLDGHGFTPDQTHFVRLLIEMLCGFFLIAIAVAIAYYVSIQGRRDYTPTAGLLTLTGIIGIVFATLGGIQLLFRIPDAPIFPIKQVWALILHEQLSLIWLSLAVYTLLFAGIWIFGSEAKKSIDAAKSWDKFFTTLSVVALPVLYPIARFMRPDIPPFVILLAVFGLSSFYGLRQEQAKGNEHDNSNSEGAPVSLGEAREGAKLIPPFDKLAFPLAILVLEIIITGTL